MYAIGWNLFGEIHSLTVVVFCETINTATREGDAMRLLRGLRVPP